MKLEVLREEASHYCSACDCRCRLEAGSVLCDHPILTEPNGGMAKLVVFSTGKCPKGSWDHSMAAAPRPMPKADAAAAEIEAIKRAEPIPREQWPAELMPWVEQRLPAEKGLGDTLKRLMDAESPPAEILLKAITSPCACWARSGKANRLYPYTVLEQPTSA